MDDSVTKGRGQRSQRIQRRRPFETGTRDVDLPAFAIAARAQSGAVATYRQARSDQAFIDAISSGDSL